VKQNRALPEWCIILQELMKETDGGEESGPGGTKTNIITKNKRAGSRQLPA
jgi:hypothetical protein